MYKLYFNCNGWEKKGQYGKKGEKDITLRFFNEQQAIQTMLMIAQRYQRYYFMIIENVYDYDDVKGVIRSEEDMYEYIEDYNRRKEEFEHPTIQDQSCLELKDFITRRALIRRNSDQ